MTDAPADQTRARGPWRAWVIVVAALAVVVGGIAALGGFNDVPVQGLPDLALGDTHHGNQVDTVVTSVSLATRLPGQKYDVEEGTQYLLVEATLLNTTNGPNTMTTDLIRVLLGDEISANTATDGLRNVRTGEPILFLQPGLPVDGVFVWEVDDAVTTGDDLIVGLMDRFPLDDPRFSDVSFTAAAPTARIRTAIGEAG